MKKGEKLMWIAFAVFLLGWMRACAPRILGEPFETSLFTFYTIIAAIVFIIGLITHIRKGMPRKIYAKNKKPKKIAKNERKLIATTETRAKILFCRECGNKLNKDAIFCDKCGTKINEDV